MQVQVNSGEAKQMDRPLANTCIFKAYSTQIVPGRLPSATLNGGASLARTK